MVLQRVVKPKTHRGKRALEAREPKIIENTKQMIIMKGNRTSETVNTMLKDICSLKKPHATMLSKKNAIAPFEDHTVLEQLGKKYDSSLFVMGTHSKKRPNSLVVGRMFDYQLLDMFELVTNNYASLQSFKNEKTTLGSKPCLIFNGPDWESTLEYQRLKNLLLDFFRGSEVEKIRLAGLEQALTFTLTDGVVYVRNYRILLKKSGHRTPRIELEEVGPSFDFLVKRSQLGSDAMYRTALKVPRTIQPKKKKNISHDSFGTKLGRVHMKKQDLNKLQLRKLKGLKKVSLKKSRTSVEPLSNDEHMEVS